MKPSFGIYAACIAALVIFMPCGVNAQQQVEDFYKNRRTINLYVGFAPGGSYDLYARMVARHLGKHIPGTPTVIVNNMPGAGSLQAANFIYNVAPRDGSALGALGETLAMEQAMRNPHAKYDATKFTWIGRIASSNNIIIVWHTSKAQSVAEAMTTEMSMAGTGPGNLAEIVPKLLNALAGTKFKVISGYASAGPGMLAMERGEVDASGTAWAALKSQRQDWLRERKAKVILQVLPMRDPELPDVPALLEFAKTEEDRQLLNIYGSGGAIGRSINAPPNLPSNITNALRDAFQKMIDDPDMISDLKKANLDLSAADHKYLEEVVSATVQVPDSVRERVRAILGN
jgi:tripartite-type tricarboxylate transporter receptor subunit TctC